MYLALLYRFSLQIASRNAKFVKKSNANVNNPSRFVFRSAQMGAPWRNKRGIYKKEGVFPRSPLRIFSQIICRRRSRLRDRKRT